MKKAKFKIGGMHCNSCAILIEGKLKDLEGATNTKVNFNSQKAVIIYDDKKITENDIYQAVRSAGNYQISKIEEEFKEEDKTDLSPKISFSATPNKITLLLIVLIVFNLGLNFVLLNKINKLASAKTPPPQNLPADNAPPAEAPAIAQFKISKNDHIRGDFNAPITLVEFSDFECPFCEKHYLTLKKVIEDYTGKVRLVYKHFPLGFHPNAQKAAEASECADEQEKFWEYHDKLFENQANGYSLEKFKQWAKDLELNSGKFNDCLDSGKFTQKVQADYQEGQQKGVNGTPATFINGQLVSGALPYESFKQIIDEILTQ